MILKPNTVLYVINKSDGSGGPMSVRGYLDALNGGLSPDTVVVTTDEEESRELKEKYKAIAKVVAMMEEYNGYGCLGIAKNLDRWVREDAAQWAAELMAGKTPA